MLVITHQGNIYKFNKTDCTESDTMFRDRCWWIIKNIASPSPKSIQRLTAMSHLWASNKYYGTTYDEEVMNEMQTYQDVFNQK
jgi:hypothetical protein